MKTYVTFGTDHNHTVLGNDFNSFTVAEIDCDNAVMGRALAFAYFGAKFAFEYPEEHFDLESWRTQRGAKIIPMKRVNENEK